MKRIWVAKSFLALMINITLGEERHDSRCRFYAQATKLVHPADVYLQGSASASSRDSNHDAGFL